MKKQKKKIGSLTLVAIAVIGIVAGVEFILAPGLISSTIMTFGQPIPLCSEAPYNVRCICPEGYDKLPEGLPFTKYTCVPELPQGVCNYPITYSGSMTEEFKSIAFACAQEKIENNNPTCESIECDSPMWAEISAIGEQPGVYTYIMVECRDPYEEYGQIRWSTTFSMQDGSLHSVLDHSDTCV